MKKIFNIVLIIFMFITIFTPKVKASSFDTYELNLEVISNVENKDFDIYILLPKSYIIYAIDNANLELEYNGVETLKENDIQGIRVNKNNIQDEVYTEGEIEYIQILLEPNEDNEYTFDILSSYIGKDMKFRVTNEEKDYIMHLDEFKTVNNVCKIEYDYDKNEIKQPDVTNFTFSTVLFIILILIVLIAIIAKIKGGK